MLLHIRRIDSCEAYHLVKTLILPKEAQAFLTEPVPWRRIDIAGLAVLETSEEVEKGVRTHTTKLTATLVGKRMPLPDRPLAYRLTTVGGQQFLLGTGFRPFPLTTQETVAPSRAAEVSAVSLSVKWTSDVPLLAMR